MALGVRPRRDAEAPDLDSRRAGHSLLVHPKGEPNGQALAFAEGLPADPEHQVVVLDLPDDPTDGTWTAVSRLLDRAAPGGCRLVTGRTPPGGIVPVGQWLADRLDRAVVVPDGTVVPAAGGVLYIPADRGSGWVRLLPRRPPTPVSRRFPEPAWEFAVSDRTWRTSERAVADPLPSGVWLHGDEPEGALSPHRAPLFSRLAYRPDLLTVVLGRPGGDALALDEVSRFWESLLPGVRDLVRFVAYGPLTVPDGTGPGQALADRIGCPVTLDNGLPVSHAQGAIPDVHTLDADGTPGWAVFARQLRYTPARLTGGRPTAPVVVGHRPVPGGFREIAPGRYAFEEAVLEVVPSGLWLRPSEEPDEAAVIRSATPSARHVDIVLGTATPPTGRLRELAERLLHRLDPALRALVRLVPAAQLIRQARARELTAGTAVNTGTGTAAEPTVGGYGAEAAAAVGTAPERVAAPATAPGPEAAGPRIRLAAAAPDLREASSAGRAPGAAVAGATSPGPGATAATSATVAGPAPAGERTSVPPAVPEGEPRADAWARGVEPGPPAEGRVSVPPLGEPGGEPRTTARARDTEPPVPREGRPSVTYTGAPGAEPVGAVPAPEQPVGVPPAGADEPGAPGHAADATAGPLPGPSAGELGAPASTGAAESRVAPQRRASRFTRYSPRP
ncbi:hypothetical protein ABZX30_20270, partial [Streptomyces sp. NPDC004542]